MEDTRMTTLEIQEYTGYDHRKPTEEEINMVMDYIKQESKRIKENAGNAVDFIVDPTNPDGESEMRKEIQQNGMIMDFTAIGEKMLITREFRLYLHEHYDQRIPGQSDKKGHHHMDVTHYLFRFDKSGVVVYVDASIFHYCLKKD